MSFFCDWCGVEIEDNDLLDLADAMQIPAHEIATRVRMIQCPKCADLGELTAVVDPPGNRLDEGEE